jgi:hypothetical protein
MLTINSENLRRISRGRVRFTYRVTPARASVLGVDSDHLDGFTRLHNGTSYRFEVSKTGRVRLTRRQGDADVHLDHYPHELVAMLLHDVDLQATLTNAIEMATEHM